MMNPGDAENIIQAAKAQTGTWIEARRHEYGPNEYERFRDDVTVYLLTKAWEIAHERGCSDSEVKGVLEMLVGPMGAVGEFRDVE